MVFKRTTALLAASLIFAFPGIAAAQSAGDDQYSDPFAGQDGPTSTVPSTTSGSSDSGSDSSAGVISESGVSSESKPLVQPRARAADESSQLAYTGSETWLIALGGAGLVLAGVGVRLRLRSPGA